MSNEPVDQNQKMPALFVGHCSPLNAIEDNEFNRAWEEVGKNLPRPKAILTISAHWETVSTSVTSMSRPKMIYDFWGFPPELYQVQYPALGSPELAENIQKIVKSTSVRLDSDWGLDHGAWSVLCHMFPQADIPVLQLSLDRTKPAQFHYDLGKELQALRQQGVLILGSGNIVHNLRLISFKDGGYDWAEQFDQKAKKFILYGDHEALVHYQDLGQAARLSIPTNEHYLPLLYILALQEEEEQVHFFNERVTMGSISMRSFWLS